jgi:hypothetical protein
MRRARCCCCCYCCVDLGCLAKEGVVEVVDGKRKRRVARRGGVLSTISKGGEVGQARHAEFERRLEIHRGDESERLLDYGGL